MIKDNLNRLNAAIREFATRYGRAPESVRLVAVSKRFPATAINEARKAGQLIFGENYIQEADKKYQELHGVVQFHFIGHLQSNKAQIAARIFSMVETVDRPKLASALNKHCIALEKNLDILIQVNIGRDPNKSGIAPEDTEHLLQHIQGLSRLRPRGLMTIPPFTEDPEGARVHFRKLRQLGENLAAKKLFHDNSAIELSMGMTHDYEIAIQEGATLVRIGTAIFGERPSQ